MTHFFTVFVDLEDAGIVNLGMTALVAVFHLEAHSIRHLIIGDSTLRAIVNMFW